MRLIDAEAYAEEMKKRQDACKEWTQRTIDTADEENYLRSCGAYAIFVEAKLTLDKMPTIDAVEVKHGEWEVVDQEEPRRYGCSVCKRLSFYMTNYCSCCGAKMNGERREEP